MENHTLSSFVGSALTFEQAQTEGSVKGKFEFRLNVSRKLPNWEKGQKACNLHNGHLNWGGSPLDLGNDEWENEHSFGSFSIYSPSDEVNTPFFIDGELASEGAPSYLSDVLELDFLFNAVIIRIERGVNNLELYEALQSGDPYFVRVFFEAFEFGGGKKNEYIDSQGMPWALAYLVNPVVTLEKGRVAGVGTVVGFHREAAERAKKGKAAPKLSFNKFNWAKANASPETGASSPPVPQIRKNKKDIDPNSLGL